ncbi:MAG: hypothetical protein CM1200mP3_03050 [Chloroflexota bacterium]|nr:MAG: hypothetical protein CM1200mP3_03050 [Chloroflexota bacterium]
MVIFYQIQQTTNRLGLMATISQVKGREIIDSRGNPTLEVDPLYYPMEPLEMVLRHRGQVLDVTRPLELRGQ